MEARRIDQRPFVVALPIAKNYDRFPHDSMQFSGLFEVVATGKALSDQSIEFEGLAARPRG